MKRKKALYLSAIVVLVILVFMLSPLRFFNPILEGHRGYSNTIEESKRRGVFLRRYVPHVNPVIINDTLMIFVKEAWLEHQWQVGAFSPQTVISEGLRPRSQLCVRLDPGSMKRYGETWIIGRSGSTKSGFGNHLQVLANRIEDIPALMIEAYPIQKANHGFPLSEVIGQFILVPDTSGIQ